MSGLSRHATRAFSSPADSVHVNGFKSFRDSRARAASIVNSTKDTMLLNAKKLEVVAEVDDLPP